MKGSTFVSVIALVATVVEVQIVGVEATPGFSPRRRHHSHPSSRHQTHGRVHRMQGNPRPRAHEQVLEQRKELVQKDGEGCDYGSWRCLGNELQRCFNDQYNTLRNCTVDTVCSTDPTKTGCIWPWQADGYNSGIGGAASTSQPSEGPYSMEAAVGVNAVSSSASTVTSSGAMAAPTAVVQASSTISVQPWYTSSVARSSSTASAARATAIASATEPGASESVIGGALWRGHGWTSQASASGTPSETVSIDAASASATASSWTNTWWTPSEYATTQTGSETASVAASAITTAPVSHDLSSLIPTDLSSIASAASSSAAGGGGNVPFAPGSNNAHYVIYSDAWLVDMPTTNAVRGYNKFILAFWLSDSGPADNAAFWQSLSDDEQKTVKKAYNDAGISLMVSAFGSTDKPTSNGVDPAACAQSLASWVKSQNLDGVDIDWEDNDSMNQHFAIPWLVTFQKTLRENLPSPYIISHAPQAPWFTSADTWQGGYAEVHRQVGDTIDFYNVQYYNQGQNAYTTCDNLLFNSGSDFPDSSVFETNSVSGVPLEKLVIGKPINAGAAANGYMDSATLNDCVNQAKANGWNAGVMYWEYDNTAVGTILAVIGK